MKVQIKKTGNTTIRKNHRSIVINYIRKYGSVSRTELFEKTNISKPTVTRIVEELLNDGIVVSTGILGTSSGRKPVKIELNPSAYYSIGINISKSNIYASIVDLSMNIKHKSAINIKSVNNDNDFITTVINIIDRLIKESEISYEKILGIGIGVSGNINFRSGEIVDFGFMHKLPCIKLKVSLENKFNLKVLVDNNANTRVLGEYWYGLGRGYNNVIFIICGEGIGSGIISGKKILRGKNNVTGEFGHMIVNLDGRKCSCGKYGCIESYCSTGAIELRTKEAIKGGRGSKSLLGKVEEVDAISYKDICQFAKAGDRLCIEILEESAFILSTGLYNLIGIVDPEIIVLSGDLFDLSQLFFDKVVMMTREKLIMSNLNDIVFEKRRVEDSLYEIGAAALIYKSFFNDDKTF